MYFRRMRLRRRPREQDHLERAVGLRNLLVIERAGAREMIDGNAGAGDLYVSGRVGAYDFAIDALDRRWPEAAASPGAIRDDYELPPLPRRPVG